MSIIQERIRPLKLPEPDCVPLGKERLDELRSLGKRLVAGELNVFVTESFSIEALSLEAAAAKLKSLRPRDQTVLVYWFGFREGIKIKWDLFITYFDDLWYPSSDDLMVTSSEVSWVLEITHEETVRLLSLDKD